VHRLTAVIVALALGLVLAASPAVASPTGAAESGTEAALTNVASVAGGYNNGCAVLTNGQARCWGGNLNGAVGNNSATPEFLTAQTVLGPDGSTPLADVAQIAVGDVHACARLTSGQLRCWGDNSAGQLGNDDLPNDSLLPVTVRNEDDTGPLEGVTQVVAGGLGTCALLDTGQVRCWGQDVYGQLGDGGSNTTSGLPVVVLGVTEPALTNVTSLADSGISRCAVLTNGQARCWGRNFFGALGDGTQVDRTRPVVVRNIGGAGPLTRVSSVALSHAHGCARLTTATAVCWGGNDQAQVGDGTTTNRRFPTYVKRNGTRLGGLRRVHVGEAHSCALTLNGRVWCWGTDGLGQGGDGTIAAPSRRRVPTLVRNGGNTGPLTGVTQMAAASIHNCVRLSTGQARCWGFGEDGQLGDGDTDIDALPRPVQV